MELIEVHIVTRFSGPWLYGLANPVVLEMFVTDRDDVWEV